MKANQAQALFLILLLIISYSNGLAENKKNQNVITKESKKNKEIILEPTHENIDRFYTFNAINEIPEQPDLLLIIDVQEYLRTNAQDKQIKNVEDTVLEILKIINKAKQNKLPIILYEWSNEELSPGKTLTEITKATEHYDKFNKLNKKATGPLTDRDSAMEFLKILQKYELDINKSTIQVVGGNETGCVQSKVSELAGIGFNILVNDRTMADAGSANKVSVGERETAAIKTLNQGFPILIGITREKLGLALKKLTVIVKNNGTNKTEKSIWVRTQAGWQQDGEF